MNTNIKALFSLFRRMTLILVLYDINDIGTSYSERIDIRYIIIYNLILIPQKKKYFI